MYNDNIVCLKNRELILSCKCIGGTAGFQNMMKQFQQETAQMQMPKGRQ